MAGYLTQTKKRWIIHNDDEEQMISTAFCLILCNVQFAVW